MHDSLFRQWYNIITTMARNKSFRVSKQGDSLSYIVPYRTYDEFVKSCKRKLKIKEETSLTLTAYIDDENTLIDEDSIEFLENFDKVTIEEETETADNETVQNESVSKTPTLDKVDDSEDKTMQPSATGTSSNLQQPVHQETSTDQGSDPVSDSTNLYSRLGSDSYNDTAINSSSDAVNDDTSASGSDKWSNSFHEETKRLQEIGAKEVGTLAKNLDVLKTIPIKVAVTGFRGTGKSTFINEIRGVKKGDETYSQVGVKETTLKPKDYEHTLNSNVVFWDLPGYGTKRFSELEYFEKQKLEEYDFCIICINEILRVDAEFINEIAKNRLVYVLRTKIKNTIRNAFHGEESPDENEIKLEIRESIEEQIDERNRPQTRLFLIDSHRMLKYDFPSLVQRLMDDAPEEKRCAIIRSLYIVSEKQIQQKAENLLKNVWTLAWKSVVTWNRETKFEVAEEKFALALDPLLAAAREYRAQFQFTSEQNEIYKNETSCPPNIQDFLTNRCLTREDLLNLLSNETNVKNAMQQPDIPLYVKYGQSNSYKLAGYVLKMIIYEYKDGAMEALEYIRKKESRV